MACSSMERRLIYLTDVTILSDPQLKRSSFLKETKIKKWLFLAGEKLKNLQAVFVRSAITTVERFIKKKIITFENDH